METIKDSSLVAACGLYCGACKKYKDGKCPGCVKNEKASWCGVRSCCKEHGIQTCAECKQYENIMDCKKFNNIFSKFFALVLRSNRKACIDRIREIGTDEFAREMAEKNLQSIKK